MPKGLLRKLFSEEEVWPNNVKKVMGIKFTSKLLPERVRSLLPFERLGSCLRWWRKESFDIFTDYEKLQTKYKRLVKGLDDESVELVGRIISRIQAGIIDEKKTYELTDLELKQKKLFRKVNEEKVQLANGCYAYKQYILPQKQMETSVVEFKHGICPLGGGIAPGLIFQNLLTGI